MVSESQAIICQDFSEVVGNTPLIRLRQASALTGCEILGKAEFLNPGGSVKDRTALGMIRQAEAEGRLSPGGLIVEGSGGNTGISLALIGRARGYRTLIVIPENQAQEKKDLLRLCGAQVQEAPAVPYRDPQNYVRQSAQIAETLAETEQNGVVWTNQWDNIANREYHRQTTGPELWAQCQPDGFICSAGTGGSLAGIGTYLKAQNNNIVIGLADPGGSALTHYVQHGRLQAKGSSVIEGIGQTRITGNIEGMQVDLAYSIADQEALPILFELLHEEGLCLGGSSAINVAGTIRLAKDLGPGKTIVTLLCDSGTRYLSRLFNPAFLQAHRLPGPT